MDEVSLIPALRTLRRHMVTTRHRIGDGHPLAETLDWLVDDILVAITEMVARIMAVDCHLIDMPLVSTASVQLTLSAVGNDGPAPSSGDPIVDLLEATWQVLHDQPVSHDLAARLHALAYDLTRDLQRQGRAETITLHPDEYLPEPGGRLNRNMVARRGPGQYVMFEPVDNGADSGVPLGV